MQLSSVVRIEKYIYPEGPLKTVYLWLRLSWKGSADRLMISQNIEAIRNGFPHAYLFANGFSTLDEARKHILYEAGLTTPEGGYLLHPGVWIRCPILERRATNTAIFPLDGIGYDNLIGLIEEEEFGLVFLKDALSHEELCARVNDTDSNEDAIAAILGLGGISLNATDWSFIKVWTTDEQLLKTIEAAANVTGEREQ